MKEVLVSLKTAKLLKEKGFDEVYNYVYHPNWKTPQQTSINVRNSYYGNQYKVLPTHHDLDLIYVACSQSLAQKWLREKHKIDIVINISSLTGEYYAIIPNFIKGDWESGRYNVYEQALEAGLIEALKLMK